MNSKKLVSAALTFATVLALAGTAVLPSVAGAQTTSSLQAQIAALLAQIQTLQGQLNTSGSTTTTSSGANTYNFTSDLTVGSTGSAVQALQQFLIGQGDLVLATPTQYFGAMTQKALAKFQAAKGISPAAGYFGPKTRAFVNSMSTSTTTTTTTTTTGTSTTTTTAPATGLQVSLASTNPAAGSLISSAAGSNGGSASRVPVLAVNFTAGNSGAVTVSGATFQKTGVLSDSAVAGAYLIQNGQVVAQYNSLNSGVLTFSGLNLSIPAGQTVTLTLAIDVSGNLAAGNTTGFGLTGVTAFDTNNNSITPSGSLPLNGNTFTVTTVNNPPLASVTIASSSIGQSVTAGTQANIVAAFTFKVQANPVYLQNINFHVIGSANPANLQNVKLLVNGVQVGATLSSVPASGLADFNSTSTSIKLNTGTNNIQVLADVMGSPSDYFQFEILNGYDVLAVDSQYNVPVSITNNGGTDPSENVQILTGQITVNQDSNTPTGNIAKGQSGVVLAKYDIYAAGEPVKVKFLDFNIVLNSLTASQPLNGQIQNIAITDDAGNQVGTSINQPPSGNSCSNTSVVTNYVSATGGTYADCFGTSGSPINYIVPANTTRVLSLKADIQNTATFGTITANLTGDSNNLQGMTSSKSGSTSGINGVTLTLVQSSLTSSQNNALGTQNVSAGTSGIRIGSYAFSASSAEGVNVNTVSVKLTPNSTLAAFQNLKLMVNGTQFGTTQGVVSGQTTYSFSGTSFNVPAGQTVNVDVYADSLSNASGTYSPATALTGYTGSGAISYTSVTGPSTTVNGQNVSFNGQPALTIAADSSNPPAGNIVQNSTGNTLAVFRFSETSNVENVKVTQLNVVDKVANASTVAAFSNVSLWNGSTELGTAASPVRDTDGVDWDYNFNSFTNALIVPQGNSVSLSLKGDAGSYTNNSLSDNTTSTFVIASSSGSSATTAASTLTVNETAVLSTSSAYTYYVTVNGITSPAQSITFSSSTQNTTSTQQNALASAIQGVISSNYSAFILASAGAATVNNNVVTITSTGTASLNASASIWGASSASIVAVNNVGSAATSATNVVARGATSNKTANVTVTGASGNPQTTLRTTLAIAATPVTTLPPASFQQIGSITLTANSAGDAVVKNLTLTTNSTSTTFVGSLVLKDSSGNDVVAVDHLASSTATPGTSTSTVAWVFNTVSANGSTLDITAGSSYTLTVWGNLSLIPSISNSAQSLTASIVGTGDFTYQDGTTGTPSTISLTSNQIPITVVNLTTPVGGQF